MTTKTAIRARAAARAAKPPRQARAAPLPPPVRIEVPPGWDDPTTFPDLYAMEVVGPCMGTEIPSGSKVIVDRTLPYDAGDLVVIFFRPDRHKPGRDRVWLKRLEMNAPSWVRQYPYEDGEDSNVKALLMVSMNQPAKILAIHADEVWAIHRCIGLPDPARHTLVKKSKR